jgi:catechol 2,3-dioxygenase-like lactoylglutathione lyase family enzyme
MGDVVGVGGVFLRVADKSASARWYAEVLGLDVKNWGGVKFEHQEPRTSVLSLFPRDATYFDPSPHPAMINLVVCDLDAVLARAQTHGVEPLGRQDDDAFGRFAWLLDPDGFKIELWEPPAPEKSAGG